MKPVFLIWLALFLSACGTAETSTPLPTLVAINLIFPLDLQPWADKLGTCAPKIPQVAVYFLPAASDASTLRPNDIQLELGNPSPRDSSVYTSQPGWEEIVVIANRENDLSLISFDQLRAIYSGQDSTWGNETRHPVQVWVFPDGSATRLVFDKAVLSDRHLTSEAMLAPDLSAMLEAISDDAYAIGYLPGSALKSGDPAQVAQVKKLSIQGLPEEEMQAAVIALTRGEPQGILRQLLLCLQADPP